MNRKSFIFSVRRYIWKMLIPSNNFAENPQKFPEIFPGNPQNFPGIFHRKIRRKCRQLFWGISRNPFRGTRSEEFLETHSKDFLITLSKEFLVTNYREFLGANSVDKVYGNSWEFPAKNSSEPNPGNFLGTIPKIFLRVPLEYLEIFSAYSCVNSLTRT